MAEKTAKQVMSSCQRSLDELKTLLSGKPTAKSQDEQLKEGMAAFESLFGGKFSAEPKRPADNY